MYKSYKKYDKENPLIHCKSCRGVLLVIENIKWSSIGNILFKLRCPHCKKDWNIRITGEKVNVIELSDHD